MKKEHTAGHHNMHGGNMEHHHSHKTHGHHVGVHHEVTKGVPHEPHGAGGTKGPGKGPSSNQFGPGEPHGGSVGKW